MPLNSVHDTRYYNGDSGVRLALRSSRCRRTANAGSQKTAQALEDFFSLPSAYPALRSDFSSITPIRESGNSQSKLPCSRPIVSARRRHPGPGADQVPEQR